MPRSARRRPTTVLWEGRRRLQVATLPGAGAYVRHLTHPEGVDAVFRPPVGWVGNPARRATVATPWLRAHLDEIDVIHIVGLRPGQHPDDLAQTVALAKASGTPLVVTAYHLSDPTGADPRGYAAQLDALMPAADLVVALTDSAAREIRLRWKRSAAVIPHPHVANFVRMRRERPARAGALRVAAHLGSLGLPGDVVQFVRALTAAAAATPGTALTVYRHPVSGTGDRAGRGESVRQVDTLVRDAGARLVVQDRPRDEHLWDQLACADVSVMPPAFGSHSLWPEICADLGTWVVVPSGAHAASQRPCLTYEPGGPAAVTSLRRAFRAARAEIAFRLGPEERWTERVTVAEMLRGHYEVLLGIGSSHRLATSA